MQELLKSFTRENLLDSSSSSSSGTHISDHSLLAVQHKYRFTHDVLGVAALLLAELDHPQNP
jgi:hypothetical protein